MFTINLTAKNIPALFVCACILATGILPAQSNTEAVYAVMNKGNQIGTAITHAIIESGGYAYNRELKMKAKMLLTMNVQVDQSNRYDEHHKLLEARICRKVNGNESRKVEISSTPGYYLVHENGAIRSKVTGAIGFSSLLLYFREPSHGDLIYSENFMKFIPIRKLGEGMYSLQLPDGKTTKYWFENGKLSKLEGESLIGAIQIVRRDE